MLYAALKRRSSTVLPEVVVVEGRTELRAGVASAFVAMEVFRLERFRVRRGLAFAMREAG